MYSLYSSLFAQHSRQLTPVHCAEQTITQLLRYFEDVLIENKLSALVVESLPFVADRPQRDLARVREVASAARSSFFLVTADDALMGLRRRQGDFGCVLLEQPAQWRLTGRFVVIADARFSALLVSPPKDGPEETGTSDSEAFWSFEPDVVYSALEYLMARVTVEFPERAIEFSNAVSSSMPKATSPQLAVSVTTKLARLLQAQAEREIAVNRIATAIRNSFELDNILQTAADEVGRALDASSCGLRVEPGLFGKRTTKCYFRRGIELDGPEPAALYHDLEVFGPRLAESTKSSFVDGDNSQPEPVFPLVALPLNHGGRSVGLILVRCDDASRAWAENELLLLHTVSDQLTVAINQAHLFTQLQQQALTDGLTGCQNRRAFEMQLNRDLHLASRTKQPLSLIMMDLDHLKEINDNAGHEAGDNALRALADCLRAQLRAEDTPARFGGDEFAIILPRANTEGALIVAERLRLSIAELAVSGTGGLSASFGLASFPRHASSRDTLLAAADQALYKAKRSGRNCVGQPDEFFAAEKVTPADQVASNRVPQS